MAATLTVMNLCFYNSLTRIPLGVAVTVEALGPLALSVAVSQRKTAWLWRCSPCSASRCSVSPAFGSVVDPVRPRLRRRRGGEKLGGLHPGRGPSGIRLPHLDGLALATAIGAVVTAPFAVSRHDPGSAMRWQVLGLGAIVGVMSSVIPYSLELISLRRLPPETFAILTCLSPVVAAVAGWLILGQHLAVTGYVAVVLVTVASIGAVRSARERLVESDTRLITA